MLEIVISSKFKFLNIFLRFSIFVFVRSKLDYLTKIENLTDSDLKKLLDNVLLNEEDFSKREIIRCFFETLFSTAYECKVYTFGSTTNGLGMCDSDIDIHVRLIDSDTKKPMIFAENDVRRYLNMLGKTIRRSINFIVYPIIIMAKCPIIKLNSTNNKIKLVDCDLNITNPFGVYNSHFINFLCQLSPRFKYLACILKIWAKLNDIICNSNMNSYTFTMLIIFFFQNCQPNPIFRAIKYLDIDFSKHFYNTDPYVFKELLGKNCGTIVRDNENTCTTFELLAQFFQ